jgi:hypothetical protein
MAENGREMRVYLVDGWREGLGADRALKEVDIQIILPVHALLCR